MNIQPSLFGKPTPLPDERCKRYEIEVGGTTVFADFNPRYFDGLMHVEFRSLEEEMPNPLTETGYRSQFIFGSCEGMTEDEIEQSIRELAQEIFDGK